MEVITFRFEARGKRAAIRPLTDLGFTFDASRPLTTTVLDTFDGRVHRAGSRLEFCEAENAELVLSGPDIVPAHLAADMQPRIWTDLPQGPFRSRIDALTTPRALLAQLQVSSLRATGVWRDGSGKVVAAAILHDAVRVVDRPDIDPFTTIEIHEVAGYDKQFRRALNVLRRARATECERDTMLQAAAAAGVDLAGFNATATVPLDPEMPAIDGFRDVLANLANTIDANWQGTLDRTDPVFLHQLRIAVRRTRTVLANAKPVLPPAVFEPAREGFAWLASVTGPPRDLDVYLLEWLHYTDPLGIEARSALTPAHEILEQQCAGAHLALEQAFRSARAADLMNGWRSWLVEPLGDEPLPRAAERPLGRRVAKRIERAHSALIDGGRSIGAGSPAEQFHDLRKDAKKLRYLLECFGSMLPDKNRKRYVKRLKALQDNLGEHQDAEVHMVLLEDIAGELGKTGVGADTIDAIGQLTARLDDQRRAARSEFAERFAGYDSPATRRALEAMLEVIRKSAAT